MSRTRLGMAVAAAVLAAVSVSAQTSATPGPGTGGQREGVLWQTISVTGVGHVTLTPDRAVFTAGVQTTASALSAAAQENAARMNAVLAALRQAGAADRDLRTSGLSIYPQQSQQEGKAPRIVGYQVSNNVTVTRDDPASMARLLEAVVNAGANSVSGVSFTVSDTARGRDAGLAAAFADARAKAEVLARAAGRTAGRALIIREGEGAAAPPVPMIRRNAQAAMAGLAPPVEPGTEEMTFYVSVVFELQ